MTEGTVQYGHRRTYEHISNRSFFHCFFLPPLVIPAKKKRGDMQQFPPRKATMKFNLHLRRGGGVEEEGQVKQLSFFRGFTFKTIPTKMYHRPFPSSPNRASP